MDRDPSDPESRIRRPELESRSERLSAYIRYNRRQILVDAALLTAWVLVTTAVFRWFLLPRWLLYVVLFTGVVLYTRVTPPWKRPYRSPDQDEVESPELGEGGTGSETVAGGEADREGSGQEEAGTERPGRDEVRSDDPDPGEPEDEGRHGDGSGA